MRIISFAWLLIFSIILNACSNNNNKSTILKKELEEEKKYEENQKIIEKLNQDYPRIPEDDKIFEHDGSNSLLYTELKSRYKNYMTKLKQEIEPTGAKFVVVILRQPESPKEHAVLNSKYGIPFILETCNELGIECIDLSPKINVQDAREITLVPRDGHWNKKGGEYIASLLAPIIKKYSTNKSTITYKDSLSPETFGDLPAHEDRILDGGKDVPYHLIANAQGLRMNHDVKFPKSKQHVLFLGGSQIYSPFLDNEFIATSVLQKEFPDKEIINAGIIAATLDDYLTLWTEKAKFCEPDVVILQTNGGDITDFFFSNRNHVSRTHKPYYPSPVEEKYYNEYLSK